MIAHSSLSLKGKHAEEPEPPQDHAAGSGAVSETRRVCAKGLRASVAYLALPAAPVCHVTA